ncbi:MAG: hypothetical protein LBT46_13520 [Planctomycetaceae bacterium]|jgi:hypothetical protein|nr:hypothetical protein [Planctomycetaceae bacterium]
MMPIRDTIALFLHLLSFALLFCLFIPFLSSSLQGNILDFIFGAGVSYDAQGGAVGTLFLLLAGFAAAIVCCTVAVFMTGKKKHTQFFRITALLNYSAFPSAFILFMVLMHYLV